MNLRRHEWSIAYRNIWRNKRRTIAFSIAMIFTVSGLTLLGGYIVRSESLMRVISVYLAQNGHISLYKHEGVSKFSLSPKRYMIKDEELTQVYEILNSTKFKDRVEFYGEFLSGMGIISRQNLSAPFIASGVTPSVNTKIYQHKEVDAWLRELEIEIPKVNLEENVKTNPNSISITKNLAEILGITSSIENLASSDLDVQLTTRTIHGDLNATNASIALTHTTGFVFTEDSSLIMPVKLLKELSAIDGVERVSIFIKDITDVFKMKKDLSNEFKAKNLNIDVFMFFEDEVGELYTGTMGFITIMAFFFIFMICSAGILSLTNVVSMNILERTKEIGTMRSLGFNQKSIARIFMKEVFIVSLFSIVAGNILIFFIASGINSLNIRIFPPYVPGTMKFYLFSNMFVRVFMSLPLLFISTYTSYLVALNKTKKKISVLISDVVR